MNYSLEEREHMKRINSLLIGLLYVGLLSGCGKSSEVTYGTESDIEKMVTTETVAESIQVQQDEDFTEEEMNNSENLYEEVINGEIELDVLPDELDFSTDIYEILDIDNDQIKEMFLKSGNFCYVIDKVAGEFVVVYEGSSYEILINEDLVKGIGYYRSGGAPTHETYQLITFSGNSDNDPLVFERYDGNEDGVYDENDLYLYDNKEVTLTEWDNKTKELRDLILDTF